MNTSDSGTEQTPCCAVCGRETPPDDLVATPVGYKCAECAKPTRAVRRPIKHPVLTMLLADDGFTYLTRPLALALVAAILSGLVVREIPLPAPWALVAAAIALGLLIGEVVRHVASAESSREHVVVAGVCVVGAAAVGQLPFELAVVGAIIGALWVRAAQGRIAA